MHKRQITKDDGRYLIIYTFDEENAPPPNKGDPASWPGEPDTCEARAEEKPDV
jgi:hypothetical protein